MSQVQDIQVSELQQEKNTNVKLKRIISPDFISSISQKGPQPRSYRWFPVGFKRVFSAGKCNVISVDLQASKTVFHSLTGFFFLTCVLGHILPFKEELAVDVFQSDCVKRMIQERYLVQVCAV